MLKKLSYADVFGSAVKKEQNELSIEGTKSGLKIT